jgi:ABC transport system ATP-binding/permease protein
MPNFTADSRPGPGAPSEVRPASAKKKLSYGEARELDTIEERIAAADRDLQARQAAIESPSVIVNHEAFREACAKLEEAQEALDMLYARWAELEKKKA